MVPLAAPIGPMLVPGVRTAGLVRYLEISGRVGESVIFKRLNEGTCTDSHGIVCGSYTYDQDYTPVSIVINKFIIKQNTTEISDYNRSI